MSLNLNKINALFIEYDKLLKEIRLYGQKVPEELLKTDKIFSKEIRSTIFNLTKIEWQKVNQGTLMNWFSMNNGVNALAFLDKLKNLALINEKNEEKIFLLKGVIDSGSLIKHLSRFDLDCSIKKDNIYEKLFTDLIKYDYKERKLYFNYFEQKALIYDIVVGKNLNLFKVWYKFGSNLEDENQTMLKLLCTKNTTPYTKEKMKIILDSKKVWKEPFNKISLTNTLIGILHKHKHSKSNNIFPLACILFDQLDFAQLQQLKKSKDSQDQEVIEKYLVLKEKNILGESVNNGSEKVKKIKIL